MENEFRVVRETSTSPDESQGSDNDTSQVGVPETTGDAHSGRRGKGKSKVKKKGIQL